MQPRWIDHVTLAGRYQMKRVLGSVDEVTCSPFEGGVTGIGFTRE